VAASFDVAGALVRVPHPARPRFAVSADGSGRPAAAQSIRKRERLGRPVVGDDLYGPAPSPGAPHTALRVQLHAWRLGLPPRGGAPALALEAPPPPDFEAAALVPSALPEHRAGEGADRRWT
ncbi:MAG TPA: hypothetical protein VNE71_17525, partial [Myxococcota bacterium]|nr:hypothetical protein [Myxococcota bacterium]